MNTTHPARPSVAAVCLGLSLLSTNVFAAGNIPTGITGLWRFQDNANKLQATIGMDLINSSPANAAWMSGPWTEAGVSWHGGLYSDGGIIMDLSWDYLTVNPLFTANGGGSYVNEYTILWDVNPDPNLNSLFQTASDPHGDDGDLWIIATNRPASIIGVDDVGFSTATFDGTKWHRVVLSVKNGEFFRIYVDGTNYLEGAGQPIDGRFSLYPDRFHLFADDNWQDAWIRCGLVAAWNRALTGAEIEAMGGWTNGAGAPSPLRFSSEVPEVLAIPPADGGTNIAPEIAYQALILDPARVLTANNAQLLLDGAPTPAIARVGAMLAARASGGLFPSGSTHTYTLIAGAGSTFTTNQTTVTVQKYTPYEWRFLNGDLTSALGNGAMTYADSFNTPGQTTFGTTDGSSVPHINGSPAKYMHVPGFTLDTDGYLLEFADSPPNVGANDYLNRYTLLMDVMVPSPWPLTWLVPFFNTDPYNLNDADFYLYGDGSVGIGYTGYSSAGSVSSNAWQRIAFVADLQANTLTYYVNGKNVKSGAADGLGNRWALYSNLDPGPDMFLFNEGDLGGVYTHELYVSSVAFTDRALSAAEVAALGGPKANGIFVPSFAPAPSLSCQASGAGVAISWPTNCIGYTLEQSSSVNAPHWTPVFGITNNTLNISPGLGSQFFRLVQ